MANKQKQQDSTALDPRFSMEMEDLKRDVQAAQFQAWLKRHQQSLTIALVLVLLAVTAASLWTAHLRSQKEAAASLYYKASAQTDDEKKIAVLNEVKQNYADTVYALLAQQQLAALAENPEADLRALMDNDSAPLAFRWQARLDLAEYFLAQGNKDAANALLTERTGKQYEQLRYYLLAQTVDGDQRKEYLQKSLDAEINDQELKERVERELSGLAG